MYSLTLADTHLLIAHARTLKPIYNVFLGHILSVEDLLKHVGIAADIAQQIAAVLAHDNVGFKTLDELKLATDQDLQDAGIGVDVR